MKKWLSENKKWLFSGVVATIISGVFGLFDPLSNNISDSNNSTASGNNSTAINTQGTTIIINQAKQTMTQNIEEIIKVATKKTLNLMQLFLRRVSAKYCYQLFQNLSR